MNSPAPQHPATQDLLAALHAQLAPSLSTHQAVETTKANLEAELTTQFNRLNDETWNTRYHNAIKLHTPADYAHQLIQRDNHTTLAGIHFVGGDTRFPFVHIHATTAPLNTSDIYAQAQAALNAYEKFSPTKVRILTPASSPANISWLATPDQHILAANVNTIASRTPTIQVSLHSITAEDALEFIKPSYDHIATTTPELAHRIPIADLEGLQGCQANGTLHTWHINNQQAGVIATQRTTQQCITGSLMWEIACHPDHQGKRSAAAAQIELARHLSQTQGPRHILLGEIDVANEPSLKTARFVGREHVLALVWLEPIGLDNAVL